MFRGCHWRKLKLGSSKTHKREARRRVSGISCCRVKLVKELVNEWHWKSRSTSLMVTCRAVEPVSAFAMAGARGCMVRWGAAKVWYGVQPMVVVDWWWIASMCLMIDWWKKLINQFFLKPLIDIYLKQSPSLLQHPHAWYWEKQVLSASRCGTTARCPPALYFRIFFKEQSRRLTCVR